MPIIWSYNLTAFLRIIFSFFLSFLLTLTLKWPVCHDTYFFSTTLPRLFFPLFFIFFFSFFSLSFFPFFIPIDGYSERFQCLPRCYVIQSNMNSSFIHIYSWHCFYFFLSSMHSNHGEICTKYWKLSTFIQKIFTSNSYFYECISNF